MNYLALISAIGAALMGCFFTAVNYALLDFSRVRLIDWLERRGRGDEIVWLDRWQADLLATTAILRIVFNLLVLVVMLAWLAPPDAVHNWWDVALAWGLAGMAVVVFGMAIPVSWSRHGAEKLLGGSMAILKLVRWLFSPLIKGLSFFDPLVRRLLGVPKQLVGDHRPVEQDLLDAVNEGERSGLVDEVQADMIEAVVEFHSVTVDQIMTPRTEIKGMNATSSLDEVKTFMDASAHSRIPIYEGDLDHIVGVLYVKDLIRFVGVDVPADVELRSLLHTVVFVPETKTLRDLLEQFKSSKIHMAIILDEYGGTTGLVTIEDVLEEIVGEIHDEYEPNAEEPSIDHIEETTYEIDGRVYIDDVNDKLSIELPEDEDYDTMGGFVFAKLGRIPDVGDRFTYGPHNAIEVVVVAAEKTRVNRVRLVIDRDVDHEAVQEEAV